MSNNLGGDIMASIRMRIRYYEKGYITGSELINAVFLLIAESEQYDLAPPAVLEMPAEVIAELEQLIVRILDPSSDYVPLVLGVPTEAEHLAWRARMLPACRKLASVMRRALDGK